MILTARCVTSTFSMDKKEQLFKCHIEYYNTKRHWLSESHSYKKAWAYLWNAWPYGPMEVACDNWESLYKTPTRLLVPETQRYVFCCPMECLVVLCRGHNSHQCVCVGIVNFFVGDDAVRSGWDRDNVTLLAYVCSIYICAGCFLSSI